MERKSPKITRWILAIFLSLIVIFAAVIAFSPYGKTDRFDYKLIQETVEIDAPVDSVFKFLGNSSNASKWSVFVDHIIPLNPDEVKDGMPGSRRRCFCNKDESGTQWDELITIVSPNKKRQLTIYNLVDFTMQAENLATEQLYEKLSPKRSKITFTVFFIKKPTLADELKMYIAAYQIKKVFAANMQNIKRMVEEKQS